jgi:pimeloyl-ACP methyl ester carboxylesterase
MQTMGEEIAAVLAKIAAGEHEAAARQFVDEVALGPGIWENEVPAEQKAMFVRNAPTFLDECNDPNGLAVDLEAISSFEHPALLTQGDQSPPFYSKVIDVLMEALPNAERRTIKGTGHVPQLTDPEGYAEIVEQFISAS